MRAIAAALSLLVFSVSANAEDKDWTPVATDGNSSWEIKNGSFALTSNKMGDSIGLVIGRVVNPKTSKIALYQWYVKSNDCAKKMGALVFSSVSGDFLFQTDFVDSGGTIASGVAETICRITESMAPSQVIWDEPNKSRTR